MRWVKIIAVGLGLLMVAAFVAQNSSRTTELSFDIGLAAWKLAAPMPIPALMGLCVGGGGLVAWAIGLSSRVALQRRVRQLEQENALRGGKPSGDGGWA
jgi:uncharacterized integral membrane protein